MVTNNRISGFTDTLPSSTAPKKKNGKPARFIFQVEHVPNPNIVIVHTRKKFPRSQSDPLMQISFRKAEKAETEGNKHPLIKSVRRIKGVLNVSSERYQLRLEKATLFQWVEILPKVRRALKKHFADGMELEEIPAHKPSEEYLMGLRLQGCDV